MLQTNKSTRFSRLRCLGILPLVAGSVLLFSFNMRKERKPVTMKADKKIVLVVDAGHGGIDRGCEDGSLVEKELNLKIAKRISELAADYNVEVHLTRSTNEYVSLADRVAISNKLHPDYFISIHVDNRKGGDIGTGSLDIAINSQMSKTEESKNLAYAVYQHIARPEWAQGNTPSEKSLYVLKNNTAPSILMEIGDIKNKAQMKELADDTKLDALCAGILEGVVASHKG